MTLHTTPGDPCPACGSETINPDCPQCLLYGQQPPPAEADRVTTWGPDPKLAEDPNEPESQEGPTPLTSGRP